MNGSVNQIKTGSEGLLHGGNSVKLSVVRTHNCAIVANELFTRVAEVSQRLVVKETLFLKDRIHLISARVRVAATKHCTEGALRHRLSDGMQDSQRWVEVATGQLVVPKQVQPLTSSPQQVGHHLS